MIVGLHDNKQEIVRREFRDKFQLAIFSPDRIRAMTQAINKDDEVICMASYISHMHTDAVKTAGGKMLVLHGGIPSLRDELNDRYETRAAA